MSNQYECILIKFRDIDDVINRRKKTRTFQTRMFKAGDWWDEQSAIEELWDEARKSGFTFREIFKVRRRVLEAPEF